MSLLTFFNGCCVGLGITLLGQVLLVIKDWFTKFNKRMPKAGEKWKYIGLPNLTPWPRNNNTEHTVTIVEIKGGWVRFAWNNSTLYQDERDRLSDFIQRYQYMNEFEILSRDSNTLIPGSSSDERFRF